LLGYHIKSEYPRTLPIQKVIRESDEVRTIIFHDKACRGAASAQFVMVWVPGYGEIPMSLSTINSKGYSSISVKPVGDTSTHLCKMCLGELIGIRGPYGNGFTTMSGSLLLVGGGIGLAPLLPLSELLVKQGAKVNLIMAGRSSSDLLFVDRAKHLLLPPKHSVILVTEDGSKGLRGLATDAAYAILSREKINGIYTCGPEKMMVKLFTLAEEKGIPMQASLERYMKCAVGICGACCIGKYLVCRDGPVFASHQLRELLGEFGFRKRDNTGRCVEVDRSF
jgi:dihydroorotate dehydrogenase electron transfer subunit